LNIQRDELTKSIWYNELKSIGLKFLMSENINDYTFQKKGNPEIKSYIDYFIYTNLATRNFSIESPLGNSDHHQISAEIGLNSETLPKKTKIRSINFNKIRMTATDLFYEAISSHEAENLKGTLDGIQNSVKHLFKYNVINKKNYFKTVKTVEDKISEGKIDPKAFTKLINDFNNFEYRSFLHRLNSVRKIGIYQKEYFKRLSFATRAQRKGGIINSLKVGDIIHTNKEEIDLIIENKYKEIFQDGSSSKSKYNFEGNDRLVCIQSDVEKAFERISLGKSTSWDGIGDGIILKYLHEESFD
jgi:hypothetical protein